MREIGLGCVVAFYAAIRLMEWKAAREVARSIMAGLVGLGVTFTRGRR